MYIWMPCFSCFTFHFHQIAGFSSVFVRRRWWSCVGVVGSSVLLLPGGRFLHEETLHWAGPVCTSAVFLWLLEGFAQTPETLENKFCQWKVLVWVVLFTVKSITGVHVSEANVRSIIFKYIIANKCRLPFFKFWSFTVNYRKKRK